MLVSLLVKLVCIARLVPQCIRAAMEMDQAGHDPRPPSDEDRVSMLTLIIERAEARIAFQSQDIDSHDTKVLAFIALDLAGAGVLTAARDSLQPWWWIPLIGLTISVAFFASTLWPRLFDSGPNLRQFYEKWGGSTPLDFHRQMMGELLDAIDNNRRILPAKEKAFNWGAGILAITAISGGIFLHFSTTQPNDHRVRLGPTRVAIQPVDRYLFTYVQAQPRKSPRREPLGWGQHRSEVTET